MLNVINVQRLVHERIGKKYNLSTLNLSNDKLQDLPISPVLKAINSCILNIKQLKLDNNNLYGVMDHARFPLDLQILDLSHNDLYAFSLRLMHVMPPGLTHLYLHDNHFCDGGRFAWGLLPKHLQILSLHGNQFQGKVDWDDLAVYRDLTWVTVSCLVANKSMHTMPYGWRARAIYHGEAVQLVKPPRPLKKDCLS